MISARQRISLNHPEKSCFGGRVPVSSSIN
jgi:hypothetical protein